MDHADLTDYVRFDEEEPTRHEVFESRHLFSQMLCIGRNQTYGPVADPGADAMATVLAGEAAFQVGKKRKRLPQWGAVMVPAGTELTVTNASQDPLVVLLVAGPPPAPVES